MKTLKSLLFAICINIFPFIGIIYLEWNIYALVFTYWLEMVVVIIFSKLKVQFLNVLTGGQKAKFDLSIMDLWWLFWLFIHFLFIFVAFTDPMREILNANQEQFGPDYFFIQLIWRSLCIPFVGVSIITFVILNAFSLLIEKRKVELSNGKPPDLTVFSIMPFVYLFENTFIII